MLWTNIYIHVYIILDYPITYRNASVNQNAHVYIKQ